MLWLRQHAKCGMCADFFGQEQAFCPVITAYDNIQGCCCWCLNSGTNKYQAPLTCNAVCKVLLQRHVAVRQFQHMYFLRLALLTIEWPGRGMPDRDDILSIPETLDVSISNKPVPLRCMYAMYEQSGLFVHVVHSYDFTLIRRTASSDNTKTFYTCLSNSCRLILHDISACVKRNCSGSCCES